MGVSTLPLPPLFLGILQGLTEFLPISSSAHLTLIPWFFQWNNPLPVSLTFDVALHAATLLAILWYLRDRLVPFCGGYCFSHGGGLLGDFFSHAVPQGT
jgi:undecaprenyl pyrophosphate phosphatase UppP